MTAIDDRVSRKSLLTRAGAGAAVLGAGSMLTATTASAAAAHTTACNANGCGAENQCEGGYDNCLGHDCCYCWVTTEGCCFCGQDYFCDSTIPCSSSNQCPAGWACASTCCGPTCVPPCGKNIPGLTICEGPEAPVASSGKSYGPARARGKRGSGL
jgi:hypothetical protein